MDDREQAFVKTQELDAKIKALHNQIVGKVPGKQNKHGPGLAITIMSDLMGGLIAGGIIGYLIMRAWDLQPYVLGMFLLLGGFAGMLNVYKYVRRIEKGDNS